MFLNFAHCLFSGMLLRFSSSGIPALERLTYWELDNGLSENISLGPSRDVLWTSKFYVLRTSSKAPVIVLSDFLVTYRKLDKGPP